MRIKIADINFEVENTEEGVLELFSRIDATLQELKVYFSHLLVDGVAVSANYQEHFEEHRDNINEIEVLFFTPEQYLVQVLDNIKAFQEKATPVIQAVSDEFYGKPDDDTWARFNLIMQGLQSLVEIVSSIISDPVFFGKVEEFEIIGTKIGVELHNLKDAAEQEDMTLVGDIMNYELLPFVESLHSAIERLIEQHNSYAN